MKSPNLVGALAIVANSVVPLTHTKTTLSKIFGGSSIRHRGLITMKISTINNGFRCGVTAALLTLGLTAPAMAIDVDGNDRKVILVGMDGVQLNNLLAANTSNIQRLHISKAYAGGVENHVNEQATFSGPGWTTLLTGVWANQHKVTSNSTANRSAVPGLYQRVRATYPEAVIAGISTWAPIHDFFSAELSYLNFRSEGGDDASSLSTALVALNSSTTPDFTFLHLDEPDVVGHNYGFGSEYNASLEKTDKALGDIIDFTESRPASEEWLVVVVTDHGRTSSGHGHGGQSVGEKQIFIASNQESYHPATSLDADIYSALPQTYAAAMVVDYLRLTETVVDADEPQSNPGTTVLRNKWNCSSNDYRCDYTLGYNANKGVLLAETTAAALWELVPVPNQTDQVYLRNKTDCDANNPDNNGPQCNKWLNFTDNTAELYPANNVYDKAPWQLVPVPNQANQFYLRNKWRCANDDRRCDMWLNFTGTTLRLYDKNNVVDKTPWAFEAQ